MSLVFRDKISCHWVKGVPANKGQKRGTPPKILPLLIGSSNVKMVAEAFPCSGTEPRSQSHFIAFYARKTHVAAAFLHGFLVNMEFL